MNAVSGGLSSLIWFIAIIALIPAALWLLKRTPMGGGGSGQGVLRSVAVLPLSTSQRIVTVEVGQGESRRWLVLGVTAQAITTLHTMEPIDSAQAEPVGAARDSASTSSARTGTGFAHLLNKLRRDRANDGR